MKLFYRYNLWPFFTLFINYLFKDFILSMNEYFRKKIYLEVLKDREIKLNALKEMDWLLLKNNEKDTTAAKIRFLIEKEKFLKIKKNEERNIIIDLLGSITYRLERVTGIDELKKFSIKEIRNPNILGSDDKYYSIKINIGFPGSDIIFNFILRDEMLMFPFSKFSKEFLKKLPDKIFTKAFIELDKHIIWDSKGLWDENLKAKMENNLKNFPIKKYALKEGDNPEAYSLLMQYLHLLKLINNSGIK